MPQKYDPEYYLKHKDQPIAWRNANPDKHKESNRNSHLMRKFGITVSQYDRMLTDQEGRCAICKDPQAQLARNLAVDHCHDTGKIRGLLCLPCNTAIGLLKDSSDIVISLLEYLKGPVCK